MITTGLCLENGLILWDIPQLWKLNNQQKMFLNWTKNESVYLFFFHYVIQDMYKKMKLKKKM